LSSIKIDN